MRLFLATLCLLSLAATRAEIERDLALELTIDGPGKIESGAQITGKLALRNQSTKQAHFIVLPGDGSEVGWREPHLYFSAERKTADGSWVAVERLTGGRCGMFDQNWHKTVSWLGAGKREVFGPWSPNPSDALDFTAAGLYRVRAHYHYRAGAPEGRKGSGNQLTGKAAAVPAFEIRSKDVEVTVTRPLALELVVSRPLTAGADVADLTSIVGVSIVNNDKVARDVSELGSGAMLQFQARKDGHPIDWVSKSGNEREKSLAPGKRLALKLGNGGGFWIAPKDPGRFELRAVYYLYRKGAVAATLYSEWVAVAVVAEKK